MGIACSIEASDSTAYLIAKPLIEFVEPARYPFSTGSSALGRCRRISQLPVPLGFCRLRLALPGSPRT
jgi:hypothetical protein